MANIFLLSWDQLGIEAVIDVTAIEKENVWAALQDRNGVSINRVVGQLMLRARYNPQRHYEIYTITVADGISEDDIRQMFVNDPQGSADLIRDRGNKVYSDRANKSEVKIV